MSIDIKKHLNREPQIYGNIKLYPLLLSDIDMYKVFTEIMCIPKNFIYIKEVLKMSYLKYLLFFIQVNTSANSNDGKTILYKDQLELFLEYITKEKVVIKQIIDDITSDNIRFHYELYIGENRFYEYDFDNIREIVLEQNGVSLELIESFNPELEKSLDFFNSSKKSVSIIDKIFIYSAISNTNIKDMFDWTITEFKKKEEILRKYEEWKVYRPLEASGQIELRSPNKIDNPFEYIEESRNRYESILISADSFNRDLKQFTK